jgi:hypothetical protein
VRGASNLDFVLSHAHSFDDDGFKSTDVKNVNCIECRASHTSHSTARGHTANEDPRIHGQLSHPNPIPKDGTSGIGTRRINCNDANLFALSTQQVCEMGD